MTFKLNRAVCCKNLDSFSWVCSSDRLSGLSPFMGDNDAETLSNVTLAEWDFDDEAFDDISEESKDFIEKLLIKRKE